MTKIWPRGNDKRSILRVISSNGDGFGLLSGIGVGGGGLRDGLQLFDDEDLGVFVVSIRVGAPERPVAHDDENPKHPEKDANATSWGSASQNGRSETRYGSDAPRTNAKALPSQGPRVMRATLRRR